MGKIRVISIHGTFADDAEWVRLDSSLQRAILKEARDDVVFEEPLIWTGRNSIKDRRQAGERLSKRLLDGKSENPDDTFVAIGHSHGGSVIAYALKRGRSVSEALAGAAFLATPFIDIRLQREWRDTAGTLITICALVLFILVETILLWVGVVSEDFDLQGLAIWVLLLCLMIPVPLSYRLAGRAYEWLTARLQPRLQEIVDSLSTAELPSGPAYAFIRSPGDEAAGFLSVMQMFAWLFMGLQAKVSALLSRVSGLVPRLWRSGWMGKAGVVLALLGLAVGLFGFAFSLVFWGGVSPREALVSIVTFEDARDDDLLYALLWLLASSMFIAGLIVVALSALATAVFVLVLVAVSVSSWAFGGSLWLAAPFIELAVEPLPRGRWVLHRLGWAQEGSVGLSHSSPYSSPDGVRALTEWLDALRLQH